MSHTQNITRIKAVYHALEELANEVVFVGGATVSLYSTRPEIETRPTDDVDIVVELAHYKDYAQVEEKLRSKGFVNDFESGVICRYIVKGIVVDIMPTSEDVLGFSNKWYPLAFKNAISTKLDDRISVRIFSSPYFLATKLDAFNDRGEGDGRFSTDFEDVVYVLNSRSSIWEEMNEVNDPVKTFLKTEIGKLLRQKYIDEWISAHLEYTEQRRVGLIIGHMRDFVER